MPRLLRLLALACLSTALAACSHGPRKHVNPPRASLQEMVVQADGQWRLSVRLQNFSNVPTTFASVDAALSIAGQDAGRVQAQPAGLAIGPESADVVVVTIAPSAAAKAAVAGALADGRSVRYHLAGRIGTRDPDGNYDFEYDSALSPVPGLAGVLR